jgi:hypothetical protein
MRDGSAAAKTRRPKPLAFNHAIKHGMRIYKIIFCRDNR